MFKELKNLIRKILSNEIFIFIILITILFFSLFWLFSITDDRDLRARCDSLEGKYSKGKCYVKGVEK